MPTEPDTITTESNVPVCPHCNDELAYVNGRVSTEGTEYFTTNLDSSDIYDRNFDDHDYSTTGECEYSCPSCDSSLSEHDVLRLMEIMTRRTETPAINIPATSTASDGEGTIITTPRNHTRYNPSIDNLNAMTCPKCHYSFVGDNMDENICPSCGHGVTNKD